jgi:lipoate-protein ligase A
MRDDMPPVRDYGRDDDLIRAVLQDGRPRARTYAATEIELVLGRGSRPEHELNLAAVLADGVPVSRRPGGGCAVLLDPGNAVVALALPSKEIGGLRAHFARLTAWMIDGLRAIGIDGLRHEGTSDLALGDRKVGGACLYQTRGALFYSTTLLVEPRLELMERYLPMPPREPGYRRHRGHREFVGNLRAVGVASAVDLVGRLERVLVGRAAEKWGPLETRLGRDSIPDLKRESGPPEGQAATRS